MKPKFLLTALLSVFITVAYAQNVGIGNSNPQAKLDVSGDLALREGTPITVSTGSNTITLPGTNNSIYRLTGATGYFTISGITAGNDGALLTLINTTGQIMDIANSSSVLTNTGADIIAAGPVSAVTLIYNATLAQWVVTSSQGFATGSVGPTGPTGASGTGPTGPTGTAGSNGATGAAGPTGAAGSNGATGAAGPTGAAGSNGATGAAGPTGAAGSNGATGAAGPTGAAGSNGATGAAGPTGAAGSNGATGAAGPTGAAGSNGATGAAGPTGAAGSNGAAGAAGPTGAAGSNGAAGAAGATGPTGPTGVVGTLGQSSTLITETGSTAGATIPTSGTITAIPGLSSTFSLSQTSAVHVQTHGLGEITSATTGKYNIIEFDLYVDGTYYFLESVYFCNFTSTAYSYIGNWSSGLDLSLGSGSHTIALYAATDAGNSTVTVGGTTGTISQSYMSIIVLHP